jgi:hypothetical protein
MLDRVVELRLSGEDGAALIAPTAGAQATVLHFWTPQCGACRATIPAVLAKRKELAAKGARVLLVCVLGSDEPAEDARAALLLWGINEPFAVDRDGVAMAQIGAINVPAIAILDSDRVLRWLAPDGVTASDIVGAIR